MRSDMIVRNNKELARKFRLATVKDNGMLALISVLTDISETLAVMTDLYAAVNRLQVSERTESQNDTES